MKDAKDDFMEQKDKIKVVRVPIETPTLWPHTTTNCYLIGNEEESILIDAGYDKRETKEKLEEALQNHNIAIPKKIVLTHAHIDHAPGVKRLADWEPIVYCHPLETSEIEKAIDPYDRIQYLHDNDTLTIAGTKLNIIHGPGHTKGHINVYIPAMKILIAGDNVVAEGTTWIGPPEGNMSAYLNTLNRLKRLPLTKIGPGHGDWIKNPDEHLDFVINRRLHRENQIQTLLKIHGELSASELTKLIYQDTIHPSIFGVAEKTTEAHLMKLIDEGKVTKQNGVYKLK